MGSRLVALAARERYGSDERVDGGETVGNSLGRGLLGGNGWKRRLGGRRGNVGNTLGMLGESSVGKERAGSDERVDGGEIVGNSLGRALPGRSEMEATRGWTDRKPWETAPGELRGEGAIRK